MPILGSEEFWSEGGNYLDEGDHSVEVKEVRFFTYNSGNQGVAFGLQDGAERKIELSFVMLENSYWRLSQFVQACGLTQKDCADYDTEKLKSHERLVNRMVNIRIEKVEGKEGKSYNEVVSFWKFDAPAPAAKVQPKLEKEAAAVGVDNSDIPF